MCSADSLCDGGGPWRFRRAGVETKPPGAAFAKSKGAESFIVKTEHKPCLSKGGVFGRRKARAIANNKSRINREVHVWFCEGLRVKFPRFTRPRLSKKSCKKLHLFLFFS